MQDLAAIHAAGVLHGDLHTGILMRAQDDRLRITDFSAAQRGLPEEALRFEMHFACALGDCASLWAARLAAAAAGVSIATRV